MTIFDYYVVMKTVKVGELKSKLSEYLRAVKRGETITVCERNDPIARIVPAGRKSNVLDVRLPRPGAPALRDIEFSPIGPLKVDVLDVLEEVRADRDLLL